MAADQGPLVDKEAKYMKQKRLREARQAKRQIKAEAKGGVDLSKQEKKRRRLHLRVEKLEAQARKIMTKAQQARTQANYLDTLKAKEDEAKEKLSREVAVDPEDSSSEEDAEKKEDGKLWEIDTNPTKEEELGPSTTATDLPAEDKREKKRKRKEEKKTEKRKREAEDSGTRETLGDDAMDVDAEEVETPKEKKKKRKVADTAEESAAQEVVSEAETPKEKKKKYKKDKKDKKDKKNKKNKDMGTPDSTEEHEPVPTAETTADSGEQWNVSALEGSDKRKAKFLRLLGANKPNGTADGAHAASASSSKTDIAKVQNDLERQFNSGMKMKNEGQSHRRGLGA